MLTAKTKEIVNEVDEVMTICMKQVGMSVLGSMGMDELVMLQKCMSLLGKTKELAVEQAEMIDSMDKKIDKILMILNERKES